MMSTSSDDSAKELPVCLPAEWSISALEYDLCQDGIRLGRLRYLFESPRGHIIFELSSPDTYRPVFDGISSDEADAYSVFFDIWRDRDIETTTALSAGRYRLEHIDSHWVARPDVTVEPWGELCVFAEKIEPEVFDHLKDLPVFLETELSLENLGHGLAVVTMSGAERGELGKKNADRRLFLKRSSRKPLEPFFAEVEALYKLRHPHIVCLAGLMANVEGKIVGLLTSYGAQGDLLNNLEAPDWQKLRWISQVLDALMYLRHQGHPYLDIKCENVVVDDSGDALLVDFDGGFTAGNVEGLPSLAAAKMLEDMKCQADGLQEFLEMARTERLSLEDCQRRIEALALGSTQELDERGHVV